MQLLSVVTIAKNEAKNISAFMHAVRFADEIIVIDNNSADETSTYARKLGATVFQSSETSLGELKNFALSKAHGTWILLLDVDEIVSEDLQKEIIAAISTKNKYVAFSIPYQNYFLGHPLKSEAQSYRKVRLFRNGKGRVSGVVVHEEVIVDGPIALLHSPLNHYSFRSIPQVLRKFTQYAQSEAPQLSKQPISLKHFTRYPAHMFWTIFVRDHGYRDGVWGALLALCFSYYECARYVFAFRHQKKN